jgi:hypothetical protein
VYTATGYAITVGPQCLVSYGPFTGHNWGENHFCSVRLTDTKAVALWMTSSGLMSSVLNVSTNTITPATSQTITTSANGPLDAIAISDTRFLVLLRTSAGDFQVLLCNVAGNVITLVTSLSGLLLNNVSLQCDIYNVSAGRYIITTESSMNSFYRTFQLFDVSGNTLTAVGSVLTVSTGSSLSITGCEKTTQLVTENRLVYLSGQSSVYYNNISISGTTIAEDPSKNVIMSVPGYNLSDPRRYLSMLDTGWFIYSNFSQIFLTKFSNPNSQSKITSISFGSTPSSSTPMSCVLNSNLILLFFNQVISGQANLLVKGIIRN